MNEDDCRENKNEDEDDSCEFQEQDSECSKRAGALDDSANPEKSRTEDGGDDDDEEELQQEKEQNQQQQEPAESSVRVEQGDYRADFEFEIQAATAFTYKAGVVSPDGTIEERREEALLRPFDE
jgi:hypothetical protein